GHLELNGIAQPTLTGTNLTPQDLANLVFRAGSGGTASLWFRAYDGIAWGAPTHFLLTTPLDQAPLVTATNQHIARRAAVAASSLFSVLDADDVPITKYHFLVPSTTPFRAGHLELNGIAQPTLTGTNLTPQDLANTVFQAGTGGTASLFLRAYDGIAWGA